MLLLEAAAFLLPQVDGSLRCPYPEAEFGDWKCTLPAWPPEESLEDQQTPSAGWALEMSKHIM